LNDYVRFDAPGKYRARVTTRRLLTGEELRPSSARTTNEVELTVVARSESEEANVVAGISDELDHAPNEKVAESLLDRLSYLGGRAATHEKVRRLTRRDPASFSGGHRLLEGLFITRDRDLVLRLSESALQDSHAFVSYPLLRTMSVLQITREGSPLPKWRAHDYPEDDDPGYIRQQQLLEEYGRRLLNTLPLRTPANRAFAAVVVFETTRELRLATSSLRDEARDAVIENFESIDGFDQENLLSAYGDAMATPILQPVIERMLTHGSFRRESSLRETALAWLLRNDPIAARPFALAEITAPHSRVPFETLRLLKDDQLPEADGPLLARLRELAPSRRIHDSFSLKENAQLVARYSSRDIYRDVLDVYEAHGDTWKPETRAALLAYFARHDYPDAAKRILRFVQGLNAEQRTSFWTSVAEPAGARPVRGLFYEQLASEDPMTIGTIAHTLSRRGEERDRDAVWQRLERWRRARADRSRDLTDASTDAAPDGELEASLVTSLLTAKAWQISPAERRKLRSGCVSRPCRDLFEASANPIDRPVP
jgi:hypothetical protein